MLSTGQASESRPSSAISRSKCDTPTHAGDRQKNNLGDATSILSQRRYEDVAIQMIELGGRPPIIRAMLPVDKSRLAQLYTEIIGRSPPTGPLPTNHSWYVNNAVPSRIVQSTYFVAVYKNLRASYPGALDAEVLVSAYRVYLSHAQATKIEPCLTMDRAWHLLREVKIRNLVGANCEKCGVEYLVQNGTLRKGYVCPICRNLPSLRKRER